MTNRLVLFLILVGFVAAGCNNAAIVRGKVIEGNLSFVGLVDERDERLKTIGMSDVEVAARGNVGNLAGMSLAQAKSDAKGDFSLSIKEQSVLLKPVEFSGSKIGYVTAREVLSIPPAQRRVLVILKADGAPKVGSASKPGAAAKPSASPPPPPPSR